MESDIIFKNREEAGIKLGRALEKFRGKETLVLGVPNGGFRVGYEVSRRLNASFEPVAVKSLPVPGHANFSFGSICEEGHFYISEVGYKKFNADLRRKIIQEQKKEIEILVEEFRHGASLPKMKNKQVIIVTDGIDNEDLLIPVIYLCAHHQADKIIVASPVAPKNLPNLNRYADQLVILEQPDVFYSIEQVYESLEPLNKKETLILMDHLMEH